MKKLILTLLIAPLSFTNTTSAEPTKPTKPAAEDKHACCSKTPSPAAAPVSSTSIYQLDSSWKNQDNKAVKLASLAGKIQIVTMGYTSCNYACPRLMADMKAIEKGLPSDIRDKVVFNFFSIDDTDTPSTLMAFSKQHAVDLKHWNFFSSNNATIQELAVILGTKFRRTNKTDFAHSNLITVLNEKGEIIHRQEGLSIDPTATIKAIKDLK